MHTQLVFHMGNVASGRRWKPDVVLQRPARNGAVFIRHVPLADQIPVVVGVTTDRTPGKVRVCLVELVVLAAKARTRVRSIIGISQNVQVSKFFLVFFIHLHRYVAILI